MKLHRLYWAVSFSAIVTFPFSQCATPPATSPGGDKRYGEVHTELTAYRDDLINQPPPEYLAGPRGRLYQGIGLFRIRFDFNSGKALRVEIVNSTGHVALDQAAVQALQQWTVKPRTWHNIDVLVRFATSARNEPPPSSSRYFPVGSPPSFRPPHSRSP
jgi:TonB family protein